MTSIDLSKYMTVDEAMAAIGCARRSLYRAMDRAGVENVSAEVLGRRLILRNKLEVLRASYFPYYSEQHQKMVKVWGAAGGKQKKLNEDAAAARGRRAGRKRGAGSGTTDAQA
jgi:hypothetical protein